MQFCHLRCAGGYCPDTGSSCKASGGNRDQSCSRLCLSKSSWEKGAHLSSMKQPSSVYSVGDDVIVRPAAKKQKQLNKSFSVLIIAEGKVVATDEKRIVLSHCTWDKWDWMVCCQQDHKPHTSRKAEETQDTTQGTRYNWPPKSCKIQYKSMFW